MKDLETMSASPLLSDRASENAEHTATNHCLAPNGEYHPMGEEAREWSRTSKWMP